MTDGVAMSPMPCADKPPAMAIVGEPGDGKAFLLQLIADEMDGRRTGGEGALVGPVYGDGELR